jgi:DNA-binding LacI/PurR family transcriptional regulator
MKKATSRLDAHDIRRVAVEACADDRTVRRYLADTTTVQSTSRARIAAAMARLGLDAVVADGSEVDRDEV